jgi:hypothetical protein
MSRDALFWAVAGIVGWVLLIFEGARARRGRLPFECYFHRLPPLEADQYSQTWIVLADRHGEVCARCGHFRPRDFGGVP